MKQPITKGRIPPETTYERWMREEGIPTAEAIGGIEDVSAIERKPWARTDGKGAFIYLRGMKDSGVPGMYVMEIPPGKALAPEKHLYEEMIYILRGRGATEIWQNGRTKRTFEWGESSFFSPPLNTWHRLYNGSREPVILIAVTTAPIVMDLFHSPEFVFGDGFVFEDRYNGEEDYFKVGERIDRGEEINYVWDTNFISDLKSAFVEAARLPKAPGGRSMGFEISENILAGHIAEWPAGIYHQAHYHGPGAILLGLNSKGYALMWPKELGTTPFKDGHGDEVIKVNWKEGAVYSPSNGWFHQHFNTGREPAKHIAFRPLGGKYALGFHHNRRDHGDPNRNIGNGGTRIDFQDEDPAIRRDFEAALREEGVQSQMPPIGAERRKA
jgi:mannose-6-phosphate isomerase-like protein (cupin superfamily)